MFESNGLYQAAHSRASHLPLPELGLVESFLLVGHVELSSDIDGGLHLASADHPACSMALATKSSIPSAPTFSATRKLAVLLPSDLTPHGCIKKDIRWIQSRPAMYLFRHQPDCMYSLASGYRKSECSSRNSIHRRRNGLPL